jgi:hypothetical protein
MRAARQWIKFDVRCQCSATVNRMFSFVDIFVFVCVEYITYECIVFKRSAIIAMATSPTIDWSCVCNCPIFSIRAVMNSCWDMPYDKPVKPRCAASYSAPICESKLATSLRCSCAPNMILPFLPYPEPVGCAILVCGVTYNRLTSDVKTMCIVCKNNPYNLHH